MRQSSVRILTVPGKLMRVAVSDRDLEPDRFAWDGYTLWLDATLRESTVVNLEFGE